MPGTSRKVDLVEPIRQVIARRLAHGHPAIRDVAATLDLNVRTLQRRLAKAGVVYSRLVEEVRLETAARLLQHRELRLAKIAAALGYSDPAHFTRAFARWTGMTPRDYRREQPPPQNVRPPRNHPTSQSVATRRRTVALVGAQLQKKRSTVS